MGDDLPDATDRFYGNHNVMCDDFFHGTFVAGVIAAQHNPKNKMTGIYPSAKIMTIRAIPQGDEYDKDIASAIHYAVDNGAKVINMSFGKRTSPDANMVEEAIRYAAKHDVLLVMASGNNGVNCDKITYYPQGLDETGKRIGNLIRVGASDIEGNPGQISNYGKNSVDLFAPGYRHYISGFSKRLYDFKRNKYRCACSCRNRRYYPGLFPQTFIRTSERHFDKKRNTNEL